jgi:hypothetical protein
MGHSSWNYDAIKAMARDEGCSVLDLIALAPRNDPFYIGTTGDWAVARWFADLWRRFGYSKGVHLRRVHYEIISQAIPVRMPNGEPYENTERCWDFLTLAGKQARYLELVDPLAFVDRRNPDPVSYVPEPPGDPYSYTRNSMAWDAIQIPDFPEVPYYDLYNYEGQQRYHIELWAEKSTMNDVLLPICEEYGAVLQTGLGELSLTATLNAVKERIVARGKPTRIFYISDFDPAGMSMPVAVSRKIEYWLRTRDDLDFSEDVKLFPIVLTANQVARYRLPRTPIKDSERRAGKFEARFGTGAVELDALQALYPGELARIVQAAMDHYYDHDLDDRVNRAYEEVRHVLDSIQSEVADRYDDQIAELRKEYQSLRDEFTARFKTINESLKGTYRKIQDELDDAKPDLDEYPIPEAEWGEEMDNPLLDTDLDYRDQITVYKEFQGKVIEA